MTLPGDEQAFLCNALAQLAPDVREVFTARMVERLQALADPGVGDVDRALRAALVGLWTPPDITEWRRSDWDCETPRFDLASKRVWPQRRGFCTPAVPKRPKSRTYPVKLRLPSCSSARF